MTHLIGAIVLVAGLAFGLFAFAQIWYPIWHALPRILLLRFKRRLTKNIGFLIFYTISTPIIWVALTWLTIWLTKRFLPMYSSFYLCGLIVGAAGCWIFASRKDLDDDFQSSYGHFIKQDPTVQTETLKPTNKISIWSPWYFTQGVLTLVTFPLFLILVSVIADAAFGAVIQTIVLVRASYAVFGFIGALISASVGWIPIILPPFLYYSLIKNLPGLWLSPDASRRAKIIFSLTMIVLLPLTASLISHGVTLGIGWIVDRDPCAAFSAGVTGSKVPVNCP